MKETVRRKPDRFISVKRDAGAALRGHVQDPGGRNDVVVLVDLDHHELVVLPLSLFLLLLLSLMIVKHATGIL